MSDSIEELIIKAADPSEDRERWLNTIQDEETIALLLESVPIEQRLDIWRDLDSERRLPVLLNLRHDPRETILDAMSLSELDALFDNSDAEALIELAETLPRRLVERALLRLDDEQRRYFEQAREYDENETGHWVSQKLLMLPASAKVRDGLRLLRREIPRLTQNIFLVNRIGSYLGAVPINSLVGQPDHLPLSELLDEECPTLSAEEDIVEASRKVQFCGYPALPVLEPSGKLVGRLDVVTANEVIEEEFESKLMASAGLDENEDLFAPIGKTIEGRSVWLGINLLTALLASWFIGLFEATLESVVALAVLMPVVASMGGIAGSQTLALIIRGLALGQVNETNARQLLHKEFKVGAWSGLIWAVVIAVVAYWWFDSMLIGAVIACAILINIVTASISGLFVPLALKRMNFDPALSGAVVLTTVTDIVGFVVFLGLGTLVLV